MLIDILFLLILIGISTAGFFQGMVKLALALVTLYASTLLTSLYFKFVSLYFVRYAFGTVLADAFSFFLLLLVSFGLLFMAVLYTFRYVRLPGRLEILDRTVGVGLGVLLGLVVCGIVAMLLRYMFIDHNLAGHLNMPLSQTLQHSTRSSRLLPVLLTEILPQIYTFVAPLLPDTALPFFLPQGR